jgi:choline dehydrogenase-like flavoprotein
MIRTSKITKILQKRWKNNFMNIPTSFDYIIVGAGAAGCVIASEIAKNGKYSVALLEEGRSDTNRWIHIPATFFMAIQSQDTTNVISEPDPSLDDRNYIVPQGRVLGGGSSVNGMIYMRGQAQDYDDWERNHGCAGWNYKAVLPTFCKQEKNTRLNEPFHGQNGPLLVSDPEYKHPINSVIIEAAINAGLPSNNDFNGTNQEGAGWYQVTAFKGKRYSAATSFLKPYLNSENLTLFTECKAERILFTNRKATAVAIIDELGSREIIAKKEIILTAGSFQSPKLLMLSGIGPEENLTRAGINVLHNSINVGANLQDHVGTPVTMRLKKNIGLHGENQGLKAIKNGLEYYFFNRGLMTSNLIEAGACADTSGQGRPDVQFNFAPFAPGPPGQPPLPFHAVQVHPMTMRPKSRSRLQLDTSNPTSSLKFLSNVLNDTADLDTLRRGVRLARNIFHQNPLKDLVTEEIWPGNNVSSKIGSNTLDDSIRKQAKTIYHPTGTCKMGPQKEAVVDLDLRVNGVDGLRVADCSVMPALVSGNTNAPTMMIAGRAAEKILNSS